MRAAVVVSLLVSACFYEEGPLLPADFATCAMTDDVGARLDWPTWYRDIQPLVTAKCQGCHVDGGIAPFELTTYTHFSAMRASIYTEVEERRMPPWQPAPCCNTYRWDRSLDDAERATLLRWYETGLPVGDPADAPDVPPPPTGLPRVDLHAVMREPVTPIAKIGADELRCVLLDHAPLERDMYITGVDFQPGVRSEVHHVTIYAVESDRVDELVAKDGADGRPGWDCWGAANELAAGSSFVASWQPGVQPSVLPDGIGRRLTAGSRIVASIHYDTGHGAAPDQSALDLMLTEHVERVEKALPVGNPLWFLGEGIDIAANDPDATAWFAWDPTVITRRKPVEIHNVMVHMHEIGTIGRVAIMRGDGTTECLLNITDWDFHWMADYYLDKPVTLEPGDQLYVECHWDNTADNQKIVNGERQEPRTLHWSTDEEMCGAVVRYSVEVDE